MKHFTTSGIQENIKIDDNKNSKKQKKIKKKNIINKLNTVNFGYLRYILIEKKWYEQHRKISLSLLIVFGKPLYKSC